MNLTFPSFLLAEPLLFLNMSKNIERMFIFVAVPDGEKGDWAVTDTLIPEQEGNGVHVDVTDAGDLEIMELMVRAGKDYGTYGMGWWHTHPGIPLSPSGDDQATTKRWGAFMVISDPRVNTIRAMVMDEGKRFGGPIISDISLTVTGFEGKAGLIKDRVTTVGGMNRPFPPQAHRFPPGNAGNEIDMWDDETWPYDMNGCQ